MSEAVVVVKRPVVPRMGAKVGPAYATIPMPLTWMDLARIRRDPNHTAYVIPFGPARGMIVVRNLERMDWKLRKGKDFFDVAKKHGNLVEGLKTAVAISKAYAGTRGVVYIDGYPYPRKAIAQKRWKEEKASEVSKLKTEVETSWKNKGWL